MKLETLEGITFATTLTQGFKDIVDAIHDLTRALAGAGRPHCRSGLGRLALHSRQAGQQKPDCDSMASRNAW